jgi:hypothetical protein
MFFHFLQWAVAAEVSLPFTVKAVIQQLPGETLAEDMSNELVALG